MLLRETAHTMASPLSLIFKKSLDEGLLPGDWERADITPIHKKGSRSEAENNADLSQ